MSGDSMVAGLFLELLTAAGGMLKSIQHDDLGRPELVGRMQDLRNEIQRANEGFATKVATIGHMKEYNRLAKKLTKFAATTKGVAAARLASLPPRVH